MSKEVIRPLLVESVERLRIRVEHHSKLNSPLSDLLADAKRELAQAEVVLWLADRQWEREESQGWSEVVPQRPDR